MGSEVIEVVERRRRWPLELRLKILDEVLQPEASVAAVADRHGVARGLVCQHAAISVRLIPGAAPHKQDRVARE